jgi:hypothetical protein
MAHSSSTRPFRRDGGSSSARARSSTPPQKRPESTLTDLAEAALEQLIDANPTVEELQDHLALLQAARANGVVTAYHDHQQRRIAQQLAEILQQWIDTSTWNASQAFAADHTDDLLHPTTEAIVDTLADRALRDQTLRLHRGLLGYAAAKDFDTAYQLRADPHVAQTALAALDPADPSRLAVARRHSAASPDNPEAHYQLAVTALFAGRHSEAAAAIADCSDNAAPYERRDYARRLNQIGTEDPDLATTILDLRHKLGVRS